VNNKQHSAALPAADSLAIELRFAAQVTAALTAQTPNLPHDVSERLRFAREQALARAREQHRLAATPSRAVVGVSSSGLGVLGGVAPWWQRVASLLPLVVLVAGLVAIDQWSTREQVLAAAEIDSQLLADDLPPDAYSDPGFAEFLRSPPP
jgi:hypothetical protein